MIVFRPLIAIVLALAMYGAGSLHLNYLPRKMAADQLDIAINPVVQVMLAGGDRALAANLNTIRLIVLDVLNLDKRDYPILAKVHRDIAFLQPCQEDNYYVAQAFLPWIGEVASADEILKAAAECRGRDTMPGFFLAFNAFYFRKDFMEAGEWFAETAKRGDEKQRDQLLYMASKFYEKGEDLNLAAAVIRGMGMNAANEQLKQFLLARALRVENLRDLRVAATAYTERFAKPLENLQLLVDSGVLVQIPVDPLGKGYDIDSSGIIQLRN